MVNRAAEGVKRDAMGGIDRGEPIFLFEGGKGEWQDGGNG
jgi:hypothetical protein